MARRRCQWWRLVVAACIFGLAAFIYWWQLSSSVQLEASITPSDRGTGALSTSVSERRDSIPPSGSTQSSSTGEPHIHAMSDLVELGKLSGRLPADDVGSLLVFISSSKPGNLTEGEWEERVNGILNLLRKQAREAREDWEVTQGVSSVPGLTDVLVAMAEANPSKVLRLYAMQHLSLWFADERDPAKRRDMVESLEKLASLPGDETAGCAVLMLADLRRQSQDGKIRETSGDGTGVNWDRVDQVLEAASCRLVGEDTAGADVRISAIHACVDRKDAGALPELRRIATDPSLVSTLRKVAIHALGQLGTVEDVALLESLPQDDPLLSQALMPARKAIEQRMNE